MVASMQPNHQGTPVLDMAPPLCPLHHEPSIAVHVWQIPVHAEETMYPPPSPPTPHQLPRPSCPSCGSSTLGEGTKQWIQALGNSGPWPGKCVVAPGEGDGWQVVTAPVQSGVRDGRMRRLLKSTDPCSCRLQVDV